MFPVNFHCKQIKIEAKTKSLEYNNIKNELFINYPILFKYDIITNPYTFMQNINNDIIKTNFDNINQYKSELYNKCYNNRYYIPNLCNLTNAIYIQNNILYDELNDNIIIYSDIIYNELNIKIEEHCNNKDTIIDYNIETSFNNIKNFINIHKNFLVELECLADKYYNIIFKIKKLESYSDFIKKIKKQTF